MEGLEIKEKLFNETAVNKDFRIDSQFYTKEPIKNLILSYDKVGNHLIRAQYGISISMNEEGNGYPIYRMNEIHNMMCDTNVSKFADISQSELETFVLNDRDVVFNRTNSFEWVGRTGLYKKIDSRDFVFASYLVRFIPNQKTLLPEYLTTFLNSKYGVWDIKRRARQSINQTNVNPEEVKEIEFPLLSMEFQEKIKRCFDNSFQSTVESQNIYTRAENLLLESLGLEDFQPSQVPINVKNFSESFGISERLDAEYYQVKYDEIISRIKNNNYSTLSEKIIRIDTGEYSPEYFSKGEKEGLSFYIRSTNLKDGLIEFDDSYYVPKKDFVRISKEGDILTARVGSVGVFSEVRKELEGSVYSDNVLCFRLPESFIPSVYTLLFNSEYYYELIDRLARGSVQQRLNQETLKDLLIPVIEFDTQREIADLVEESFKLKKQSEHFLEVAKTAVEMAIEQDEETAMKYIIKEIE